MSVGSRITASVPSIFRRSPADCRAEERLAGCAARRGVGGKEHASAIFEGGAEMRWLRALDQFSRRHLTKGWTEARRREFIANLCIAADEPSEPRAVQRALDQMDTKASGTLTHI